MEKATNRTGWLYVKTRLTFVSVDGLGFEVDWFTVELTLK